MEGHLAKLLTSVAAALLTLIVPLQPLHAEMLEVEVSFVKADTNGDLYLSKSEFLTFAIMQFDMTDGNGDGIIQKEEVGELASGEEFKDNDSDGDGALSLDEVVTEKLRDFNHADANRDGKLSLIEVLETYQRQASAEPEDGQNRPMETPADSGR